MNLSLNHIFFPKSFTLLLYSLPPYRVLEINGANMDHVRSVQDATALLNQATLQWFIILSSSLSKTLLKQAHDVLSITLQKNTTSYGPLSSSSRLANGNMSDENWSIGHSTFIRIVYKASKQKWSTRFSGQGKMYSKRKSFLGPRGGQNLFSPFDQLPPASSKLQRFFASTFFQQYTRQCNS